MLKIRMCEDLAECQRIWSVVWPDESLFDLWQVRACFAESFSRLPSFLVAEERGAIKGLLPLSWIEEAQCYGHFPGEIWQAKTWLEQNKILASDAAVFAALLANIPGPSYLRYLTRDSLPSGESAVVDEIGYLFLPGQFNFSFSDYMLQFSGKSRKNLRRELDRLEEHGVTYRHDHLPDVELLFSMNRKAYGEASYFIDPRFQNSFEKLVSWLHKNGMLRVTTILLGGVVAAVDIGAIWRSTYTVLAGGTNTDFPGVAKMINFHHLEWACRQRFASVDFLCGDFGWKERFHLTSRPLYKIQTLHSPKKPASHTCRQEHGPCPKNRKYSWSEQRPTISI